MITVTLSQGSEEEEKPCCGGGEVAVAEEAAVLLVRLPGEGEDGPAGVAVQSERVIRLHGLCSAV